MKRFLRTVLCFGSLVTLLVLGVLVWRIGAQQSALRNSLAIKPGQTILFVGDSHIAAYGASTYEKKCLHFAFCYATLCTIPFLGV